ncbi:hypothetical protein VQ643_07920 [Pseudomonas sp. F1_0610]|uniref:DUF7281 domain-containing protein n=1 Tax=Pseudomonas sp. F1_0610 TaxID=3114284 RepID=UPI0039C12079
MILSGTALRVLRNAQNKMPQDKPLAMKAVEQIKTWCEYYDIDLRQHLRANHKLRIDTDLIAKIEHTLAQLNLASINKISAGKTSMEQIEDDMLENKNQRLAPSANHLVCAINAHYLSCQLLEPQCFYYLDVDYRTLNLQQFKALVVVENLDVFYSKDALVFIEKALNTRLALIVYKGHDQAATSCVALKARAVQQGLPCIYYGDFDSRGVNIALTEGYTHILLPVLDSLKKIANTYQLNVQQLPYNKALDKYVECYPESPLAKYLLLITKSAKGLLQQTQIVKQIPLNLLVIEN